MITILSHVLIGPLLPADRNIIVTRVAMLFIALECTIVSGGSLLQLD